MRKGLFFAMLCMALTAQAQTKDGGISKKMLSEIENENMLQPADRALVNAIAANAIDDLSQNRKNAGALDTHFSIETKKQSITDQKSSGRCWMFSGLNVLRSDFNLRTDSLNVTFSQAYLFFYDQLEKANLMLQGCIDTGKKPIDDQRVQFFFHYPINDGGTFCGVADLTEKYGLVPTEVMPESYSSDNTSKARALIASKLREFGLQLRDMVQKDKKTSAIEKAKTRMLSQIYHMLQYTIGEPPQKFTYAFKNSTILNIIVTRSDCKACICGTNIPIAIFFMWNNKTSISGIFFPSICPASPFTTVVLYFCTYGGLTTIWIDVNITH